MPTLFLRRSKRKKKKNDSNHFSEEWNGWANEHLFIPSITYGWILKQYAMYGMNQIDNFYIRLKRFEWGTIYCVLCSD